MDIIRTRYDKGGKILVADSVNWAGVGLACAFDDLPLAVNWLCKSTGVYILVKYDEAIESGRYAVDPTVYIGESTNLHVRLQQHRGSESLKHGGWANAYAFYSAGNRLTGTHALHLEHQLIRLAQGRCMLKNEQINNNAPGGANDLVIGEAEMFLDNLVKTAKLLGVDFLDREPKPLDDGRLWKEVETEDS